MTGTKQLVSPRARGCSPASKTVRDVQALLSQLAGKASSKMGALLVSWKNPPGHQLYPFVPRQGQYCLDQT